MADKPSRRSIYSSADCKNIAGEYDGSTESLDALVEKWASLRVGVTRRNLMQAARRGGYAPSRLRKPWGDPAEDEFLRANWHRLPGDEIARALGRTFESVNLRRKRIGVTRYDGDELTIKTLEELTKIDHRQWHEFIERGWLKSRARARRKSAAPITYVSLPALHSLLQHHPEILDYRGMPKTVRAVLELDRLPDPPGWKRVVCRSDAWREQVKATPNGRAVTHGKAELTNRVHRFQLMSCAAAGGTSFWTETYRAPQCPRCGCQVSRYSEEGLFSYEDPGQDETVAMQAAKLGLSWDGERLVDGAGREVNDADVLHSLFNGRRGGSRSVRAFESLIKAGLTVAPPNPVGAGVLLDNILRLDLTASQEEAFAEFLSSGCITAAHAMSFGKSTLGLMALTRIPGKHLLLVDTQLLREQWIEKFREFAPRVEVRQHAKPVHRTVSVFEPGGDLRCIVEIFNYATHADLGREDWVIAAFDEVHRLPAARAHRHSLVRSKYRLGMSATADLREDGRGALVSKLTGALIGGDWQEQMERGLVRRLPVKVMIVEDLEHKHEVVGALLREHTKVVVLCEAIADGRELETRYGVPFVSSSTRNKLAVVRAARSVVLSRVGDASLSVRDCEVTVDHSGLFGSRIQSLQRLGRLMHSERGKFHAILMTREERYERFGKRIEAIVAKGFPVEEVVVQRERASVHTLLTPTLRAKVRGVADPLLGPLGIFDEPLSVAA
jgi:hypothetical protein